jgi:hypothetical protein
LRGNIVIKPTAQSWLAIVIGAAVGTCDAPAPVGNDSADQPTAAARAAASERIVYSSLRPGNWDIFYFASAGAAPRRLTDHPGLDYDAAFSPDGAWLVYTSERGGISDEEPIVQEVVFGPQMDGELFARCLSDGFEVRLKHNEWEEGNPFWLRPAE